MASKLEDIIQRAWDRRAELGPGRADPDVRQAVDECIAGLDEGTLRVAERRESGWVVNQWLKQAVLLSFRLNDNRVIEGGHTRFFDKVPLKYAHYEAEQFKRAGTRVVPDAVVRRGAFVAADVVLMPSFVNIGAYVDEGTMVDTWATVGSCAQIGKHCHISGGAGIGGVLEPLQASPTIIEDNCFIGARSEVAEGVVVRHGSVLSMGVYLTSTTPIVDRRTGETITGEVPPFSVIMSGSRPNPHDPTLPSTYCAVIMKTVDERTRSKTSINELLRD